MPKAIPAETAFDAPSRPEQAKAGGEGSWAYVDWKRMTEYGLPGIAGTVSV